MHLSKRLKSIADMVTEGNYVIDIGCDHALLDIYLTLYNNNRCIASDVSKNALKQAEYNIKKYHLTDKIEVIESDGLKNINLKSKSTIIISGMGTSTIIDILKYADKLYIKDIIIQSNNDLNLLRREICFLGYYIKDEEVIYDKGIYYVVIKFEQGYRKYNKKDYELGPILKTKEGRLPYYNYLKNKNREILKNIPKRYIKTRYKLKVLNMILK